MYLSPLKTLLSLTEWSKEHGTVTVRAGSPSAEVHSAEVSQCAVDSQTAAFQTSSGINIS